MACSQVLCCLSCVVCTFFILGKFSALVPSGILFILCCEVQTNSFLCYVCNIPYHATVKISWNYDALLIVGVLIVLHTAEGLSCAKIINYVVLISDYHQIDIMCFIRNIIRVCPCKVKISQEFG